MADKDDVDIELLIEEVKRRPEIWNMSHDDYHDRNKKRDAWIGVCKVFIRGFDKRGENEKNIILTSFAKKWRNVKDGYIKSVKKKMRSGQALTLGRRYVYARQLSFLLSNSYADRDRRSQDRSSQDEEDDEDDEDEEECIPEKRSLRRRHHDQNPSKTNDLKRKLELPSSTYTNASVPNPPPAAAVAATPSVVIAAPPEPPNPDKSFFECILPSIKDFTEDQRLEFRVDVLNTIKRIRMSYYTENYGFAPDIPHHSPITLDIPRQTPVNLDTPRQSPRNLPTPCQSPRNLPTPCPSPINLSYNPAGSKYHSCSCCRPPSRNQCHQYSAEIAPEQPPSEVPSSDFNSKPVPSPGSYCVDDPPSYSGDENSVSLNL